MTLARDERGLESLPLKLIIVAIIATMSVVPASQALESFRDRDYMMRAQVQLENIVSAAETLLVEGLGAVRTLQMDFERHGGAGFESLSIGDRRGGPNMSLVILRTNGGGVIAREAGEPQVWLRSTSGSSLDVRVPSFAIRLSTQLECLTPYVLAELV
jgi:hypothetical protein